MALAKHEQIRIFQTVVMRKLKELVMGKGGLRTELSRGAVGSLGLKLGGTLLGLLLAVLLARTLGPEGYGVYAYVFALVSLLAIPAQVGLPTLVVRETAMAQANEQWGLMRGLWRWSSAVAGAIALVLALLALLASWVYQDRFSEIQIATFGFGLVLVPLVALGNLRGAALRGLRRVVTGQLPEMVLRPTIFILLLLVAILLIPTEKIAAATAMGLHALAAAVAFFIGAVLLWRARPKPLEDKPIPLYEVRSWITSALPLAFVAGMMLINQHTDILMLGLFRSAEEVGVYRVAVSIATLVAFGLQAVTMVVAPHFARLYSQNDMARLQRLVTLSARAILAVALPVVLVLVLFGGPLLRLIFGEEYSDGYTPMAILAGGQLVNAAMGSVGGLLNMTGHERETARGVAIAAAANVVLNLLLIPPFGLNGAALATALSMTLWNLVLWQAVRLRLNIDSMAFTQSSLVKAK
jgi:O-antigen/teichoic acid export membrane protein